MESEKCTNAEEKPQTKEEVKYFRCEVCELKEVYDYFGNDPPFAKHFKLSENAYVLEDPFVAPKQNEFIVLGAHCIKCNKSVCKDNTCSLYYKGTYCIHCAKTCDKEFPETIRRKLNKIIT